MQARQNNYGEGGEIMLIIKGKENQTANSTGICCWCRTPILYNAVWYRELWFCSECINNNLDAQNFIKNTELFNDQ